ncbi:MAG: hypothetical protein Q9222_005847 [Ikaeria aurantiellina]
MSSPSEIEPPSGKNILKTINVRPESPVTGSIDAGEPDAAAKALAFSSPFQETLFIFIIGLSQLFAVGGLGNTAYSTQHIGRSLHATTNAQTSWFLAAYSLSGGTFVLIAGRLGDYLGHKNIFVFGWLWMALWSSISGFAHNNLILFDFARGMTGIGSGALVPNSFALLARAFSPFSTKKNIAFSFLGFCAPAGYIFGGLIGAAFAETVTWRWGYWFWALSCLVVGMATYLIVPHAIGSPVPGLTLRQFDYIGTILGVTGLTLFSFAWNQASVVGWAEESYTYILLILGTISLLAFAASQSRVQNPILPNSLWPRKGFLPIVTALAMGWMSFGIFLYYTTLYLLTIHHLSPLLAVAQMTPLVIGGFFATASVAVFLPRVKAEYIFSISMLSFLLGDVLMSCAVHYPGKSYWAFIFPACLLVVGGPDLSFASSGILVSNAVTIEEQGVAGSFVATVVQYSISLGLGIAATVERYVSHQGSEVVMGYRGVYWLGTGFAAVAVMVVVVFVRDTRFDDAKRGVEKGEVQNC